MKNTRICLLLLNFALFAHICESFEMGITVCTPMPAFKFR